MISLLTRGFSLLEEIVAPLAARLNLRANAGTASVLAAWARVGMSLALVAGTWPDSGLGRAFAWVVAAFLIAMVLNSNLGRAFVWAVVALLSVITLLVL